MENKYTITKEQKNYFASTLLLENMTNFDMSYPVLLEGDDTLLEAIFLEMLGKKWVEIIETHYSVTEKGREVVKNYLSKLSELRSAYKVFSCVDTGEGEFAYSNYFDFETDEQFTLHANEDRFEDLRVAVCEFKGINPLEMIFLELVDENRFDTEVQGWQADLTTGLIWNEMMEIANSNIHLDDLAEYTDEDETEVLNSGKDVMEIIIKEGTEVILELVKNQEEADKEVAEDESDEDDGDEEVSTTVIYVEEPVFDYDYYEAYYDPYYVSPYWGCYY